MKAEFDNAKIKESNEIWKPVKDYEGIYEVSNLGRVKSLKKWRRTGINSGYFQKDKILKQDCNYNGYAKIDFHKNKVRKGFLVHRLVAEAFIPNPENKPQINHKNKIKLDNKVENLEWVTSSENIIHAFENGRRSPKAIFSDSEARDIIKRKIKGEKRKNVWKDYKDKIKEGGFQGIWYGKCYKKIWEEFM